MAVWGDSAQGSGSGAADRGIRYGRHFVRAAGDFVDHVLSHYMEPAVPGLGGMVEQCPRLVLAYVVAFHQDPASLIDDSRGV